MPFFSVIIPLYNKEKFIVKTLQSVLDQVFTDFEVIIINDGSTDTSEDKVLSFKDSRIQYFYKENEGVSSARNLGIEKARSHFITFIDADDYWHPTFLEKMHYYIIQFPQQKVFSAAIEFETSKKTIPSSYSIKKTNDFEIVNYFQSSTKTSVIWTSCAVFHKSVFEKVGVFDVNIKSGQDTDLWIRIGLVYSVLFSWEILARYIYDAESLSKNQNYSCVKLDFSKFEELEKTNSDLKKFLDLNRFSLAIKSKLSNKNTLFNTYSRDIDLIHLSYKKRILLQLPAFLLKRLITLKSVLADNGYGSSVFK